MPLYDYDCAACGRRIEVVHGVHAPAPAHCPNCGSGPLKKAITAPAVHFKGSGWAKRDRRVAVASGAPKASTDSGTATVGDKDGGPASGESKPDGGAASGADGADERAAASPKSTGAGAATKAD